MQVFLGDNYVLKEKMLNNNQKNPWVNVMNFNGFSNSNFQCGPWFINMSKQATKNSPTLINLNSIGIKHKCFNVFSLVVETMNQKKKSWLNPWIALPMWNKSQCNMFHQQTFTPI
jgi:hypothetical protein